MEFQFVTKACTSLSDQEFEQCSVLFSNHYGTYSGLGKKEHGTPIKLPPSYYKREYSHHPEMYVSLCYDGDNLLGQAFFLRKEVAGVGLCSWVTQLVVHNDYRNRKIGTRLLQSAWGFSNYYACGLATANAITIKTLESVTWKEVSPKVIEENKDVIKQLMQDVPFAKFENVTISDGQCQVFTDFYPELEDSNESENFKRYSDILGKIVPGYEWLAFTFADQKINYSEEKFKKLLDFSEHQLKDAYSRMTMPLQGWAKGTKNEVDYIVSFINDNKSLNILDLGCGQGRHSLELAARGFQNIVGVDFSESNVKKARKHAFDKKYNINFMCGDARFIRLSNKYDLVLCIYDVIGSFREYNDNLQILDSIKYSLNDGAIAIVSVMNMELTESIANSIVSLKESPESLLNLKPSNTMAVSGNIFNPEYFLINKDDSLVYRKEQFDSDGMLSAEYIVADKRYKMDEMLLLVEQAGFKVLSCSYVQAGRWDTPLMSTDPKAKELLIVMTV